MTYEKCLEVLGAVDVEVFIKLLCAVEDKNVDAAIDLIEEVMWQGREISQFIIDFTWFMRNLLLLKSSEGGADRLDFSKENLELMRNMADRVSFNELMRYIRIFSELSNNIRYATQKRVLLELAVIKLCVPAMEQNYDSIVQRLDDLTKKVDEYMEHPQQIQVVEAGTGQTQSVETDGRTTFEEMKKNLPEATIQELQSIASHKEDVYGRLEPALANLLRMSDVRINKDRKTIVVMLDEYNRGLLEQSEEDRQTIENAFVEVLERQIHLEYRIKQTNRGNETDLYPMEFFETKGVPFGYDDN